MHILDSLLYVTPHLDTVGGSVHRGMEGDFFLLTERERRKQNKCSSPPGTSLIAESVNVVE